MGVDAIYVIGWHNLLLIALGEKDATKTPLGVSVGITRSGM